MDRHRHHHTGEVVAAHPVRGEVEADIKETKAHLDISINDLVLAMSAGALRKLSLRYDGHADSPLLA
ncbi:hypothetical protein, partial [Mycolicibacterium insubricum]|uniref:hypothetical protein n=1 Tax=Mycolicibacterium insubricum TaxID=444597 RepID=UPI0021F2FAF0